MSLRNKNNFYTVPLSILEILILFLGPKTSVGDALLRLHDKEAPHFPQFDCSFPPVRSSAWFIRMQIACNVNDFFSPQFRRWLVYYTKYKYQYDFHIVISARPVSQTDGTGPKSPFQGCLRQLQCILEESTVHVIAASAVNMSSPDLRVLQDVLNYAAAPAAFTPPRKISFQLKYPGDHECSDQHALLDALHKMFLKTDGGSEVRPRECVEFTVHLKLLRDRTKLTPHFPEAQQVAAKHIGVNVDTCFYPRTTVFPGGGMRRFWLEDLGAIATYKGERIIEHFVEFYVRLLGPAFESPFCEQISLRTCVPEGLTGFERAFTRICGMRPASKGSRVSQIELTFVHIKGAHRQAELRRAAADAFERLRNFLRRYKLVLKQDVLQQGEAFLHDFPFLSSLETEVSANVDLWKAKFMKCSRSQANLATVAIKYGSPL